jgi:hypothetical protein
MLLLLAPLRLWRAAQCNSQASESAPTPDRGRIEIPQCSDLQAHLGVLSFGRKHRQRPRGFRTIQFWPKDLPAAAWQAERAVDRPPGAKPSLSSSPWMRGAPHSGFSALIRRINARRSAAIRGRPPRERDFQRQYWRKQAWCHRSRVSGRIIVMALRTEGNHRYSWTKNRRSPFVSWTRPRTLRCSTIS